MSQTPQTGHSIVDIYKTVMSEVISSVKESFLDENVDVEVLQQLKKEWEAKLIASGSVDWDGSKPMHIQAVRQSNLKPSMHTTTAVQSASSGAATIRVVHATQPLLLHQPTSSQLPQTTVLMHASNQAVPRPIPQIQYIATNHLPITTTNPSSFHPVVQRQSLAQSSSAPTLSTIPQNLITLQPGQKFVQQTNQQPYIMHTGGGNLMILQPNGQQIPVTLSTHSLLQQSRVHPNQVSRKMDTNISQIDGSFDSLCIRRPRKIGKTAKDCHKTILQLDGDSRMSDLSSDDDDIDDDEDDDPLRRIADRIGDEAVVEDEDQVVEEDPLNSDDDQSDDDNVEQLFEAENVVMCQFEKVHRARSKWKFILKDGIMHINGRDHCFQRCCGEAEW